MGSNVDSSADAGCMVARSVASAPCVGIVSHSSDKLIDVFAFRRPFRLAFAEANLELAPLGSLVLKLAGFLSGLSTM